MAENDRINLRTKLNSMSWHELRKEAAFYSIKANVKKVPLIDAIIEKMAAEEVEKMAAEEFEKMAVDKVEKMAAEEVERMAAEEFERMAAEKVEKMAAEEDPLLDMSALSLEKFVEPFLLSNSRVSSRGLNLDTTMDLIRNATFDVINDATFDVANDATYDVINDATFDVINDKTYDVLDTSGKQPDDEAIESLVEGSGRIKLS